MSSSSSDSDSDSDEFEPTRRIKFNIRPKNEPGQRQAADVNEIKASVNNWRPLGPPAHPSLTRRQPSLSSVSSVSFGGGSIYGGSSSCNTSASLGVLSSCAASSSSSGGSSNVSQATTTNTALNKQYISNSNHNNNNITRTTAINSAQASNWNTSIRSSPSCSSLVNEFNNNFINPLPVTIINNQSQNTQPSMLTSSFHNTHNHHLANSSHHPQQQQNQQPLYEVQQADQPFQHNQAALLSGNRTASPVAPSPLTLVNQYNYLHHNQQASLQTAEPVPIAIAIQETIELIVTACRVPSIDHPGGAGKEPKFTSRSVGNVKVAFPNAFVSQIKSASYPPLKICMDQTDNIVKYYASRLIKDLKFNEHNNGAIRNTGSHSQSLFDFDFDESKKKFDGATDAFDSHGSGSNNGGDYSPFGQLQQSKHVLEKPQETNSKVIEFNMVNLTDHLKLVHQQSPKSRYYNVDVLRYQLAPISCIDEAPLQVCIYWKIESDLVKIRVDFKHSSKSGVDLDRFKDISFAICLADFVPSGICVKPPVAMMRQSTMNSHYGSIRSNSNASMLETSTISSSSNHSPSSSNIEFHHNALSAFNNSINLAGNTQTRAAPPPLAPRAHEMRNSRTMGSFVSDQSLVDSLFSNSQSQIQHPSSTESSMFGDDKQHYRQQRHDGPPVAAPRAIDRQTPSLNYQPPAIWDESSKQITWKFDSLTSYEKSEGFGSLFAKLDFRNTTGSGVDLQSCNPSPVEVKFLLTESTLSKINMSINVQEYKVSLLKKEIRSGRYKSEPYIL